MLEIFVVYKANAICNQRNRCNLLRNLDNISYSAMLICFYITIQIFPVTIEQFPFWIYFLLANIWSLWFHGQMRNLTYWLSEMSINGPFRIAIFNYMLSGRAWNALKSHVHINSTLFPTWSNLIIWLVIPTKNYKRGLFVMLMHGHRIFLDTKNPSSQNISKRASIPFITGNTGYY